MSVATFAKKIIDSVLASSEDWPVNAVYKTALTAEEKDGSLLLDEKFFETKEELDQYVEALRAEWDRKNLDAQVEVFEWDLGPNHIATHIFRRKKVYGRPDWKGFAIGAAVAVAFFTAARAVRR